MKYSSLIVSIVLTGCLGGGGDTKIQEIPNKAPEATITSPTDGETFAEGTQRFQGGAYCKGLHCSPSSFQSGAFFGKIQKDDYHLICFAHGMSSKSPHFE